MLRAVFFLTCICSILFASNPARADEITLSTLRGTWISKAFEKVKNVDTEKFEMRLKIESLENVEMSGTDKRTTPPNTKSVKGRIEGNHLILENGEQGEFEINSGRLRLKDAKLNNFVVFEKQTE